MAEHRNEPEASSSSGYLFPADNSLIQRLLYAPGISWLVLRIIVFFGPLVIASIIFFSLR